LAIKKDFIDYNTDQLRNAIEKELKEFDLNSKYFE